VRFSNTRTVMLKGDFLCLCIELLSVPACRLEH
jgi:hypothetical protein